MNHGRGRRRTGLEREAPPARLKRIAAQLDEAGLNRDLGGAGGEAEILGPLPRPEDERGGGRGLGPARLGRQQAGKQEERSHARTSPREGPGVNRLLPSFSVPLPAGERS